ncbi:hypothetical protein PENTCL1PPCAC_10840, partial [Pristionchus entomophagus]
TKNKGEDGKRQSHEDDERVGDELDPSLLHDARMELSLASFKLRGRIVRNSIYDDVLKRLRFHIMRRETKLLLRLFERGIGFHHSGMNTKERGAVEILFRSGH